MVRLPGSNGVRATALLGMLMLVAAMSTQAAGQEASPAVASMETGPRLFTATRECTADPSPPADADADAGYAVCETVASDARLSGTSDVEVYTIGDDERVAGLRAAYTLSNEGGTWTCTQFGAGSMENGLGSADEVCIGEAGYAGLTAYMHSMTPDLASHWALVGWVEGE